MWGVSPRALYCGVDTNYGLGRSLGDCRPALPKGRKYQMVKAQTNLCHGSVIQTIFKVVALMILACPKRKTWKLYECTHFIEERCTVQSKEQFSFWLKVVPPLVWLIVCTVQTYNDLVLSFSEGGKLIFSQLFFIWIHTYIFANQWLNDNNTLVLFSPTLLWKFFNFLFLEVCIYREDYTRNFPVWTTGFAICTFWLQFKPTSI